MLITFLHRTGAMSSVSKCQRPARCLPAQSVERGGLCCRGNRSHVMPPTLSALWTEHALPAPQGTLGKTANGQLGEDVATSMTLGAGGYWVL